MRHNIKELA